jgi:hypothetical protein
MTGLNYAALLQGDPADQAVTVADRAAYHGLVRGVIRVTLDAAGSKTERELRAFVNVDNGKNESSTIWSGGVAAVGASLPAAITVTATAGGLTSGRIMIPVSTDPKHSVLSSAAASVGLADLGE